MQLCLIMGLKVLCLYECNEASTVHAGTMKDRHYVHHYIIWLVDFAEFRMRFLFDKKDFAVV